MAQLFEQGQRKRVKNISLLFLTETTEPKTVFFTVGVPKKKVNRAVDRNRLKRQLRDAVYNYTDWKKASDKKGVFMVLFNGKGPEESKKIKENIRTLLDAFFLKPNDT